MARRMEAMSRDMRVLYPDRSERAAAGYGVSG
jgi:hypothetical protein